MGIYNQNNLLANNEAMYKVGQKYVYSCWN